MGRGEREGYGGPRDVTSLSLRPIFSALRTSLALEILTKYSQHRILTPPTTPLRLRQHDNQPVRQLVVVRGHEFGVERAVRRHVDKARRR